MKTCKCLWERKGDCWTWTTNCGNKLTASFSSPIEHGMVYCCFCGRVIYEKRPKNSLTKKIKSAQICFKGLYMLISINNLKAPSIGNRDNLVTAVLSSCNPYRCSELFLCKIYSSISADSVHAITVDSGATLQSKISDRVFKTTTAKPIKNLFTTASFSYSGFIPYPKG